MSELQFTELLASISLQAAVLVAATHWLSRVVANERACCRMWTVTYVALLMLVAADLALPHPRLLHPWIAGDAKATTRLVEWQFRFGQVLFVIWIVGAAVSAAWLGLRSWRINRFLKTCRPLPSSLVEENGLIGDLPKHWLASKTKQLQIFSSPRISTPFCWQWHRPCIVLPEFLLAHGGPELRYILRHEMEHLRTGHPLQLFLQRVIETLFWFHPMIWWASHQSARVREFACDAASIDSGDDVAAYLRSLLLVVERATISARDTTTTMTFGRGGTLLAERARRLVCMAQRKSAGGAVAAPLGLAATVIIAATVLVTALWFPLNPLASSRAVWSPWPKWSASVLHGVGISVRDYETFDRRAKLFELAEHSTATVTDSGETTEPAR